MKSDRIKSASSLERWLNACPENLRRRAAESLATRVACRVVPAIARDAAANRIKQRELADLPICREILALGVSAAALFPQIEMRKRRYSLAYSADGNETAASSVAGAAYDSLWATSSADAVSFAAKTGFYAANVASIATRTSASAAYVWEQIRDDARMIEAGDDPVRVRLWSIAEPDWFSQLDGAMRAAWQKDNPAHWNFWTRWWDGVLSGQQLDWKLQEAVALIPDEVWEQGPSAVAEVIAEIEEKFRKATTLAHAEALLHAALADYTFDEINRVMRMVPFEEDIRYLRDPARLADFLDDTDSIRDNLELFSRALAAEGALQHAGFVRTYLDGVLDEFSRARQLSELRVGRVVELGKILEEYAASEQVAAEFGPAIHALRSHVQSLLDLTRRHFAATMTRMAPLRDLTSGPDDNQWDLLQDIQRGIKAMALPSRTGRPPLAKEDQNVLLSMVDSIERLLRQNDVISTPQGKSSLRREVDYGIALLTVSVGLYLEKAKAEDHGPGKVLDWIATQYKRATGVAGLWELVRSLLS